MRRRDFIVGLGCAAVDAMFNFALSSLPLVRQGRLRALAVLTAKRLSVAPRMRSTLQRAISRRLTDLGDSYSVPAGWLDPEYLDSRFDCRATTT